MPTFFISVKPATPAEMDCKKMIYPNFGKCSFDMDFYKNENNQPQTIEVLIAKLEDMESDYDWDKAEKMSLRFENDITLPNLTANTQYVIKARAVNEAGTSEYTNEISLETTDPWAPQAPSSVSMECSEYCVVSWEVPNDHGSPILKYRVSVQEMKVEKPELEKVEITRDQQEPNNGYHSNEDTATSDETIRDTTELSSIEEESTSDTQSEEVIPTATSLEYSSEILPTDPTASVEKEEVNDEVSAFGVPTILEVDGEEHQLQLSSVKPHSYYKISVAAVNSVGQGEAAEIEHQTDGSNWKSLMLKLFLQKVLQNIATEMTRSGWSWPFQLPQFFCCSSLISDVFWQIDVDSYLVFVWTYVVKTLALSKEI